MNPSVSTPPERRKQGIHTLWLLLIGISARNSERFEPTQAEIDEIQFSCLKTALTPADLSRLTDKAARFCQVQAEIQSIGDPLPAFNRTGVEIRSLTNQARAAALAWQHRIRPLEKKRRELGMQITRAAALRAESENIQRVVSRGGINE